MANKNKSPFSLLSPEDEQVLSGMLSPTNIALLASIENAVKEFGGSRAPASIALGIAGKEAAPKVATSKAVTIAAPKDTPAKSVEKTSMPIIADFPGYNPEEETPDTELMRQAGAAILPEAGDYEAMVKDYYDAVKKKADPTADLNLGGLASIVDFMNDYKTNLKGRYETGDKSKLLSQVDRALDDYRDAAKLKAEGIKLSQIGKQESGMTNLANSILGGQTLANIRQVEMGLSDRVRKDTDDMLITTEQMARLNNALESNTYGKVMPVLSIIAKTIGSDQGMLSNQDINRTLMRTLKKDLAQLVGYVYSDPNQELDPKETKALKELVSEGMALAVQKAKERYRANVDSYGSMRSAAGVNIEGIASPFSRSIQKAQQMSNMLKRGVTPAKFMDQSGKIHVSKDKSLKDFEKPENQKLLKAFEAKGFKLVKE